MELLNDILCMSTLEPDGRLSTLCGKQVANSAMFCIEVANALHGRDLFLKKKKKKNIANKLTHSLALYTKKLLFNKNQLNMFIYQCQKNQKEILTQFYYENQSV